MNKDEELWENINMNKDERLVNTYEQGRTNNKIQNNKKEESEWEEEGGKQRKGKNTKGKTQSTNGQHTKHSIEKKQE